MDLNIKAEIKQSKINGLFQEVEEIKSQRSRLKDAMDRKIDKIIAHIKEHGNVLAYKNNEPHVLTIKNGTKTMLDKATLAGDLGITQRELNLIGVAELVEEKRISSDKIKEYEYEEPTQKLSARKAKKSDIELILGGRQ